jgi:hypothetical protein
MRRGPSPKCRWRQGGAEGNEILTSAAAVVLVVLLVAEGITIVHMRRLFSAHMFIGLVLIPPVIVKLGSTGYRMVSYYAGARAYRVKDAPLLPLRLMAAGAHREHTRRARKRSGDARRASRKRSRSDVHGCRAHPSASEETPDSPRAQRVPSSARGTDRPCGARRTALGGRRRGFRRTRRAALRRVDRTPQRRPSAIGRTVRGSVRVYRGCWVAVRMVASPGREPDRGQDSTVPVMVVARPVSRWRRLL